MKLIISNVSGVPIYEQIKQQIKAAILSGDLQAEETLPSLRTLAKDLNLQSRKQSHRSNKSCKNGKSIHRGITSPFGHFNGGKNR